MNMNLFIFLSIISGCVAAELKQVTEPLNHVEGPHWDADQNVLYYTDILSRLVLRYDPQTNKRTQVYVAGGDISPVLTVANSTDEFVVGRGRELVYFKWDGKSEEPSQVTVLASVDADLSRNKFNDGKADSQGRIWAGTIEEDGGSGRASLFLFDRDDDYNPIKKVSATTSNGLAWTDDDKLMYYIDSPTTNVDVFDYDSKTAQISNRRKLFNTIENGLNGVPDGMTLDADGNLWVAVWGASSIAHVNATNGQLIAKYPIPAKQVSSCVWGGRDLDTLYITTSRQGLSDDDVQETPLAGAVFALINTGLKGQKTNKVVSSCVWGGRDLDTLYITTSRAGLSEDYVEETPLAGAVFALVNTGLRGQKTNKVVL